MSGKPHTEHLSSDDLLRYHRHELRGEELRRIEEHVGACELCRDALNGIEQMPDAMRLYRITHELKRRSSRRLLRRKKIFSILDLVTVILIVFLLGMLVMLAYYFIQLK